MSSSGLLNQNLDFFQYLTAKQFKKRYLKMESNELNKNHLKTFKL